MRSFAHVTLLDLPLTYSTVGAHTGFYGIPYTGIILDLTRFWRAKRIGGWQSGSLEILHLSPELEYKMSGTKEDNRRKRTPSLKYGETSKLYCYNNCVLI